MNRPLAFGLLLVLLLLGCQPICDCRAQEGGVTDHLVPIDPYPRAWRLRYISLVRECLQVPDPIGHPTLMLYLPSSEPEECVELQKAEDDYMIIYTVAERNIYYSMPENNKGVSIQVKVQRFESKLDRKVGIKVEALWNKMLSNVRYKRPGQDVLDRFDGDNVEFWHNGRFGTTDDPTSGSSKLLTEIGKELIKHAKSKADKRETIRKNIDEKCDHMQMYLDAAK